MPKISIIIAMYNIDKYIAHCIESCINQKHVKPEDYEIIIVNDGSTDNSLQIAQETINGVTNARIINRINGGLSVARNTGIENATGEYIWFVDGDDAIDSNSINVLLSNIYKTHCDAYIINFSTFELKDTINTSKFTGLNDPTSGEDYHFKYDRILPMMAWLTIFKTKILNNNNLTFYPGIIHEDLEFSIRTHHKCSSILFIEESLYKYRIERKDSIMGQLNKNNTRSLKSLIQIIDSFKIFFGDNDNTFTRKLYGTCATLFFINRYSDNFVMNDTTNNIIKIYKHSLYKYMWKSRKWKQMAFLLLILFTPNAVLNKIFKRLSNDNKLM